MNENEIKIYSTSNLDFDFYTENYLKGVKKFFFKENSENDWKAHRKLKL